jgi:integrase
MATIYKRGKTYWIKWYEGGKPKYESLKTRDKKQALVAKAAKELEQRTGVSVAQSNCTFKEFSEQYLSWHASQYPWSISEMKYTFESVFNPTFGSLRLASIDPIAVEQWRKARLQTIGHRSKRTLSRTYINSDLKKLKAVLNKAVEWGVIPRNTISAVKPLQQLESNPRKFFTGDQLQAIYEADPKYAAVFKLMANTGMRISEAVNLKWENVNQKCIYIVSTSENYTKSRKWREVPLSPGAVEALEALRAEGKEYVLPDVHLRTIRWRFKKACEKAGLEGTPHELRHTFISQLVMQGVPLRTVQVLAGHSTITITEQYSHLSPDHLASSVSGLRL